MAISTGDKERDEQAYKSSSNTLQTLVIIFFGFILFFSYVLVPYYFMGDKYQSEKDIVFFLPMVGNNLTFIRQTFQNFTSESPSYLNNLTNLNTREDDYFKIINGTKHVYDQYVNNITISKDTLKSMIEHNSSGAITFTSCYLPQSTFKDWIKCNSEKHRVESKNGNFILLDLPTTNLIDKKIANVKQLIGEITSYNDKANILNSSDLSKWNDIVMNWNQMLNRSSNTQKIDFHSIDNYLSPNYYAQPPKSPKERQNLTADIENEIKSYSGKIESLEYPIVGKVPVFNINGSFLSFPFLIALGFSFLSLQFKKLIKIRKDLNLNNKNERHKFFMSWIDPLQPFPERIYPIIIIILPFILFVIFSIFIYYLWYENDPYMIGSMTGDLLRIPDNFKNIFFITIVLGALIFGFAYYQIIRALRYQAQQAR